MMKIPSTLTIAGSDSGGGAGIQADLKTFAFHGVHGCTVITCITAQNTITVTDVLPISTSMINNQLEAVFSDFDIKALKIGMLLNEEIMITVANFLMKIPLTNMVIDPVMVSRTGSLLIDNQAIATIKKLLIPKALILTPNIYEAQLLSGVEILDIKDMEKSAQKIYELGAKNVLIKGGARKGKNKGIDLFYDGKKSQVLQTKTIETKNTHGTGCTLAAAITANLALEKRLFTAVVQGKEYVTNTLEYALDIGAGCGPVGHFYSVLQT